MSERSARLRKLLLLLSLLLLNGCSLFFPNMAAAVEPQGATVDEAFLGLLADFEMLIDKTGLIIGWLFGG